MKATAYLEVEHDGTYESIDSPEDAEADNSIVIKIDLDIPDNLFNKPMIETSFSLPKETKRTVSKVKSVTKMVNL